MQAPPEGFRNGPPPAGRPHPGLVPRLRPGNVVFEAPPRGPDRRPDARRSLHPERSQAGAWERGRPRPAGKIPRPPESFAALAPLSPDFPGPNRPTRTPMASSTLPDCPSGPAAADGAPAIRIRPSRGWVSLKLGELWAYRELLFFLTWRDVQVRYKQTALGAAWAVLQPLLT